MNHIPFDDYSVNKNRGWRSSHTIFEKGDEQKMAYLFTRVNPNRDAYSDSSRCAVWNQKICGARRHWLPKREGTHVSGEDRRRHISFDSSNLCKRISSYGNPGWSVVLRNLRPIFGGQVMPYCPTPPSGTHRHNLIHSYARMKNI